MLEKNPLVNILSNQNDTNETESMQQRSGKKRK